MRRLSRVPQALKQGFVDGQKPDRFYGTARGLTASRKRAAATTRQRYAVRHMLTRIGLT